MITGSQSGLHLVSQVAGAKDDRADLGAGQLHFRAFLDFVLELREQTGIPHTLSGLKVGDDKVDQIVKMAPEDPTAGGNPVKLDRRAARTIFMRALEGRL